jgi:hypothetical protein
MKKWTIGLILLVAACSSAHDRVDGDTSTRTTIDAAAEDAAREEDARVPPAEDATVAVRDTGVDASEDATSDATVDAPDLEPDGGELRGDGVRCGTTSCTLPAEACRATCGTPDAPSPVCIPSPEGWEVGECPDGAGSFPTVVARCDGPEDCPSEVCTILLGSLGNYPQCGCAEPGGDCAPRGYATLCHSLSDCPTWASRCTPNTSLLEGFYRTCEE